MIQDEQLIRKIIAGNQQALRILIERYKHHVVKVVYSVIRDEKQAEDIAQETFIKMIDALPSYQHQGFKTWLSRIAFNKALDYKRKKQRQKEDLTFFDQDYHLTNGEDVETNIIQKDQMQKVRDAIEQLPEKLRFPVKYYHLEGLSYKEIAQRLEIEETTVKMRLYRARKWMKANWKEDDF